MQRGYPMTGPITERIARATLSSEPIALAHLVQPWFTDAHRTIAAALQTWIAQQPATGATGESPNDVDATSRAWVARLGAAGWLQHAVPADASIAHAGSATAATDTSNSSRLDARTLCIVRELLATHHALADFAFAMQGLGSGAITLDGTSAQRAHWLPRIASGQAIAAFALSEPDAGSDAAAITTTAERTADGWTLHGTKTWISNGGIADVYCVFARTDSGATGARGISAFIVPANTPGLVIAERIHTVSPHPLATLRFDACKLPNEALLGAEGSGFKLAMRTLDIFRVSVAAAALGFARRALHETVRHVNTRRMFGATLGEQPLAHAMLGDMATALEAVTLLTYRAAWARDTAPSDSRDPVLTRTVSMAKLSATEEAQRIIDQAVQLHGGLGVTSGSIVERLYRDIRALRIYEGASEVQRLLIGRSVVRDGAP